MVQTLNIGQHVWHRHIDRFGVVMATREWNKTAGVYFSDGRTLWCGWENLDYATERQFALEMAEGALFEDQELLP